MQQETAQSDAPRFQKNQHKEIHTNPQQHDPAKAPSRTNPKKSATCEPMHKYKGTPTLVKTPAKLNQSECVATTTANRPHIHGGCEQKISVKLHM